jgi:hypothetical protein
MKYAQRWMCSDVVRTYLHWFGNKSGTAETTLLMQVNPAELALN